MALLGEARPADPLRGSTVSADEDTDRFPVTRNAVGVVAVVLVGAALLVVGGPSTVWSWALLALGVVLLGVAAWRPLRAIADHVGSAVVITLLTAFLFTTGGVDSIYQDLFVVVLVVSATTRSWRRLGLDVALVVAGNVLLGLVDGAGAAYWQDLALDLVIWLVVSIAAGGVTRRLARASVVARRLRSAVDLLEDAVLVVDAEDMLIQYANRAAHRLAGRSPVVGRAPADVGPWPAAEVLRAAQSHGPTVREVATADDRVLEVRIEPVERAGRPAVVLLARDVTARREDRRRLEERERRFRALAEESAGVVYRVRVRPGAVEAEFVGPQLRDVLGLAPEQLRGDPGLIVRRMHPEDRPLIDLTGGKHVYGAPGTHSYRVQHADGRWIWLEDHHTPEFDDAGQLVAVQGIAFDVSARRQAEAAEAEAQRNREVAAETLRRTAQMERTFLQSMSHELRTPMHAIMGFARTLHARLGMLSAHEQGMLLERLLLNAVRLDDLLQTLLEFDRSSRGEGELDRRLARVDELVGRVAEAVPLRGRQLRARLEPVEALVDTPRLERCVERLLGNAVRHTPAEATIRLRVLEGDGCVRIEVEDDGPGVAAELVPTLFEPFRQGPQAEHDASPGLGFGLPMVRVCAQLHGGDAFHESVEPHGARFVVELPRTAGGAAAS